MSLVTHKSSQVAHCRFFISLLWRNLGVDSKNRVMEIKNLWLALGLLALCSCGGIKQTSSEEKKAQLEQMVNERSFRLEADWVNPMATQSMNSLSNAGLLPPGSTPNRINIVGITAFLEVKKDSVAADLPYWGERQFGTPYNSRNMGIQFEGVPRNFEISYNERKKQYEFEFDITNDMEAFNVSGILFSNLTSQFSINSTQRFVIGYDGKIRRVDIP